jgi:hypothetical protein
MEYSVSMMSSTQFSLPDVIGDRALRCASLFCGLLSAELVVRR